MYETANRARISTTTVGKKLSGEVGQLNEIENTLEIIVNILKRRLLEELGRV